MLKRVLMSMSIVLLFSGCIKIPEPFENAYNSAKNVFEPEVQEVYTSDKDVLMFILDASGSMSESDQSGKVKMVAAQEMLKDISSKLDSQKTNIGLVSFSNGCNSSTLLIKPSNNDLDKVISVSKSIHPSGKTPLAASIRKTGEILKNIDKKINIIIVSDGIETCQGNPVEEARRLKNMYGINAKIYVVGYNVDSATQTQLENLAKAGGGSYYSAQDGAALGTIVTGITDELEIKTENWQGDTFKFKINFDSGSSALKSEDTQVIEEFASYLKRTQYSAELQGHTDTQGSIKQNQKLSQYRAQSVVNKLIEFGVVKENVYAVGYGELAPIADNATEDGRFENRRVEAHLIKDGKMNISIINDANSKKVIDVKNADKYSFIGYYKVIDPRRSYAKYHMWMEFYANGHGVYGEYQDNQSVLTSGTEGLAWQYEKNIQALILDYSDQGKKPGWAKFQGKLSGNTNAFNLSGHWGGGQQGSIVMTRITEAELKCMKQEGNFIDQVCSK